MGDHITIGAVSPRIQYLASGTDTVFTYPFPIFRPSDIAVYLGEERLYEGFSVTGAGRSEGGTVVFDMPPSAGTVVTLRRLLTLGRVTDFQENGELRAAVLNDELDVQAAALQQVAEEAARALRFAPFDTAPEPVLPSRAARANRLIGFDSAGVLSLYPATGGGEVSGTFLQAGAGAVPRPVTEKLAETLSVRDFGAAGDGLTDDRAALEAAFAAAATGGRIVLIPEGDFLVSGPVALPAAAAGLVMRGRILYAGSSPAAVLTLGSGGPGAVQGRLWQGIRVVRTVPSDWSSEDDIGVLLRTPSDCSIEIAEASGFTIGVQVLAESAAATGTTLTLGRIANNRIGLDLRSGDSAGALSTLRVVGGRFVVAASVNPSLERFGVRVSAPPGANRAPSGLVFDSPFFALGAGSAAGIPFLVETDGRSLVARDIRLSGPGSIVARHTGSAEDHLYDVAAATVPGPLAVEYGAGAGRAGAAVVSRQAAIPSLALSRPVATIANLRASAFRWSATQTGFDQLACIDGTAAAPATLAGAARPGLDGYTLGPRGVTLGPGRGLGFVVRTGACRNFALALDGDPVRLVVFCFDASGALLTDAAGVLVRLSTGAITYDAARGWWVSAAELNEATGTALPAIWLSPLVATALIGVVRGAANAELRGLRLTADPRHAPSLLFGLPDLPHGKRELVAETSWDPPALVPNASAVQTVTVPGAAIGDHVTVGFGVASADVLFFGTVFAADTVAVMAWNRSAFTIDLPSGTLRLRVIKT